MGLGSSADRVMGNLSGQVIYAMRVSRSSSMRDYDEFCRAELRGKIPDWRSRNFKNRVGDCIYDFANREEPRLRRSVHNKRHRETDLGGKNVLLSDHFLYFGNRPRRLPAHLFPIIHQAQGHKSWANAPYLDAFEHWIGTLNLQPNKTYGEPIGKPLMMRHAKVAAKCRADDCQADSEEEIC